jgi:hypothetical protein
MIGAAWSAIVRLARWAWSVYLVYLGLGALFLLGLLLSDGAWWALPLFAFFAFVAYVQIRNRRRWSRRRP